MQSKGTKETQNVKEN